MRAVPLLVCALLVLVGCGKKSDPPPANLSPGGETSTAKGKKGKNDGSSGNTNTQGDSDKKKGDGTKQDSASDGLAFDPKDAQKTLTWLIKRFDKVRTAKDGPARAEAWKAYTHEVKAAAKQKIIWAFEVDQLIQDDSTAGYPMVVLKTMKSHADTAYRGLRLAPSRQPGPGTTYRLRVDEGADTAKLRPQENMPVYVTVQGTVEKILTPEGLADHPERYEFEVRLLPGYSITPAKK
jgi:hypothetical protein